MSQQYTYRDPILSLWQAAVAEVHRRRDSVLSRMASATSNRVAMSTLAAQDDMMSPVHLLGVPLSAGQLPPADIRSLVSAAVPAQAPAVAPKALAAVPIDCAKTAAKFLWAEITGDQKNSDILAAELKDAVCNIGGWSECVTTYLAYKATGGKLPYRPNMDIIIDLGTKTKLAIIGDWGTGDEAAINLLQQVAALGPEVLVHLGDVYFAGTQNEQQANFLDICRQVLGSGVPLFTLCGNHDMYSGGNGYYWLIDQIGQRSSYFALQTSNWQFLAMDTGHNDDNPITVNTNMTSLVTDGAWSEANWHLKKIQDGHTKNLKTVLLSHHQLFSPFGSVGSKNGQNYAYNQDLFGVFQNVLPNIEWWFWGHEHTLAIFDPYIGLRRGRCVGASAVPVFTDQQKYTPATGLQTPPEAKGTLPTWQVKGQLGNNGTDYNHCFAMMTLKGPSATVDYYEVPVLGTASKLFSE